jgi:type IV secretion system protein VirB6
VIIMGLIEQVGTSIDTSLVNYVQTIYIGVYGPIATLLNSMAVLALMFMAVNHLIQFRAINYSIYLHWFLRYIILYFIVTMWMYFQDIYNLFVQIPGDYAALMVKAVASGMKISMAGTKIGANIIDPSRITDVYSGMDEFGHAMVWIAKDFIRDTSINNIGRSLRNVFLGVLILATGGFFLAAGAIIILVAKVGFMVAISLAPLATVMLMMDQTKHHFESWVRFAVGFAVVPLLTTALMTVVLYLAGQVLAQSGYTVNNKYAIFDFMFIMIAALVLLFQLPTMASTLASASVAAVGGGAAMAAKSMVTNKISSAAKTVMGGGKSLYHGGQRLRDMAGLAIDARKAGASPGRQVLAAISGFRQSAVMRNARRDERLAGRLRGPQSERKSAPNRYYGRGGGGNSGDLGGGGGGDGGSGGGGGENSPELQNNNNGS